jgi:hypothetical protein
MEDMHNNPKQYAGILSEKREKFVYHIRHGRVSPKIVDKRIELLSSIAEDVY